MKKITTNLKSKIILITLLLTSMINVWGAAISWTGNSSDGLWSTAGNWSGNAVPGTSDDVTIGNGYTVTISSAVSNINSLVVSGTLTITSSGSLFVDQLSSINPIVNITGGNIQNEGSFSVRLISTAANGNVLIAFQNGTQSPVTNATFNNTGTLSFDLRSSTGHSNANASKIVQFNQTTANTVANFNLGGTISFSNITAQARFMELTAGNAEISGTQTFGSSGTPTNLRFVHGAGSGTLTFTSTANFTIHSNYTNGSGVINSSNTGTLNFINNGNLSLTGYSVTGSAINLQPQNTSGTFTFTNYGTISAEGSWAASTMYFNGLTNCNAVFENKSGATLILKNTNTSSANGAAIRASINPNNTFTNHGTINLEANSASRAMYFGDNSSVFDNYGTVTTNNAITGNDASNACVFNNKSSGVFNFNLSSDISVAVSNNKAITFNNYGTIKGIGILASGKFNSLSGTIDPGIGTGTGIFRIYNTSYTLTGKCIMQVKGKTTAGTDYDQIIFGFSPNGTFAIDPSAEIQVSVGGTYTPTHLDNVALFTGYSGRTNSFTPANISIPSNWSFNYTSTSADLKYLAPSITVSSVTNVSTLGDVSASDITVSDGNELTINAATTAKSITVAPGAKLTLQSGETLTTTNGITLQSDENGTATLVDNTTENPQTINATVQQYVTQGRNWYLSIPLATVASSVLDKGTSVVYFNESTGQWLTPAENTLNKLQGYIQTATTTPLTGVTGTVQFEGELNTGAHAINTLTRTAGKSGFNLVGNPYPSYLDWNLVTKTNVSNTMWYRTKEGGVYKFYTYVANDGAGVGVPASVTNQIPPMQAFWVRVINEGTGSIAVDNNMRSHKDVSGNILRAPKQNIQKLIRLQVSNGTNNDETVIYTNPNALNSFDSYDAQKRSNENPEIPEIFTQVGTEKLVINGVNELIYNTEIPLGFNAGRVGNFTISATELKNIESEVQLILKDKLQKTETVLSESNVYNFTTEQLNTTIDRFSLVLKTSGITTKTERNSMQDVQVFVNAANQITIISPTKWAYAIYNSVGQKMTDGITNANYYSIGCKLQAGMYVIKFSNGISKRIIIK